MTKEQARRLKVNRGAFKDLLDGEVEAAYAGMNAVRHWHLLACEKDAQAHRTMQCREYEDIWTLQADLHVEMRERHDAWRRRVELMAQAGVYD